MAIITAIPSNIVSSPHRIVFKGGKFYNAKNNSFERKDVEVIDGKIGRTERDIPTNEKGTVVKKLSGNSFVGPGWIDLHAHFFGCWGEGMDTIQDEVFLGVTTSVDAGSAGPKNIEDFIQGALSDADGYLLAMLNIAPGGLANRTGENKELTWHSAIETAEKAIKYRDKIKMIKIRIGKTQNTSGTRRPALLMAKEAAELAGLPLMVHIEDGVKLREIMEILRPGDIITHAFRKDGDCCLLDSKNRLKPYVVDFLAKGGRLDIGHGAGGFHKETVEAGIAQLKLLENQNYEPLSTSTDLHCFSVNGPVYDLPTTIAKMISLGMTREDAIRSVTRTPAEALGLPASRWRMHKGDPANLTIWEQEVSDHKVHRFIDPHKTVWKGREMLKPTIVFANGQLIEIGKI
ncbi:MAG: hypothetical protein A3B68_07270 [Candidatus Melainabacteria bacterium RIFCSPHIGHO2_02_FULL_34_12]|nr:MAG: hypothetical protein A3B68_07270 [Candidatus Melainabacteria bacterium RIFCSPHIGHO2_02_FULL_34_12]